MVEKIEDLLQIDTESNKAGENKALLKKLKQILKQQTKEEKNLDKKAEEMPYEAVSVVGNRLVTLKFNLDTREGVVTDIKVDSRDTRGQNHMAFAGAAHRLKELVFKYRGDNGNE